MRRILVLANGPGELWCWVRPMIKALSGSGFEVSLFLLPCQYAAGNESAIARRLGAVEVRPPGSVFGTLASKDGGPFSAILQLGGDLLFGLAFSARHKVPLFCYTYGPKPLLGKCDLVFSAFGEDIHQDFTMSDNVIVAGDLVADSLEMDDPLYVWPEEKEFRVVLFPGSRKSIRTAAMPFIRDVSAGIEGELPRAEMVVALSPFSDPEEVGLWQSAGMRVSTLPAGSLLKGADLAVTQPGTNTLELAYSLTPGVVVLPFSFLRHVPLSGFMGVLGSIPLAGRVLKEKALRLRSRKAGFLAWPNRLAGAEVLPELVGDISAADVSRYASLLLKDSDRRESIRASLEKIRNCPGAARFIAGRISETVG